MFISGVSPQSGDGVEVDVDVGAVIGEEAVFVIRGSGVHVAGSENDVEVGNCKGGPSGFCQRVL